MCLSAVLIMLSIFLDSTRGGCRVYLNGNLTQDQDPLILDHYKGLYNLMQPSGPFFELQKFQQMLVGCSTKNNILLNTGTHHTTITCIDGQQFTLPNRTRPVTFDEIRCRSSVASAIRTQNATCANSRGRLYVIGFEVGDFPFIKYFQTCYDLEKSSAIYSAHLLPGGSLSYAQINNNRPSFKVGGVTTKLRLTSVYTQNHQHDRFKKLLSSLDDATKYINSKSYLAKGHLTPDGDAIINNWAEATYFYINAVPQWQVINAGNWLRVENMVRKAAVRLNDTVHVYTGVHDILRLPDVNGSLVNMTLGEDGLVEVPKWLWKVVVHVPSNSAVVFITMNNPFSSNSEHLCRNICSSHGWHHQEFLDSRKGFTICCSLFQAQKSINSIPTIGNISNILHK
ncbi:uncharacterized protein LOC131214972 [Anopheles bellator]|uniref:uncharacterized protein LOC131214972 n=1 Tax=Anopheles bellator TaxID=139047 RepID=UPI0026492D19|nr:uncharacterized protein LOC131214972 [Anopheles bellator]